MSTKRSDFDTLLAVYTGDSVDQLTPVASNDDIILGEYQQSYLSFPATAGTTYRIAVDGYAGAVGTVVLNVDPPANDDFEMRRIGELSRLLVHVLDAETEEYALPVEFAR